MPQVEKMLSSLQYDGMVGVRIRVRVIVEHWVGVWVWVLDHNLARHGMNTYMTMQMLHDVHANACT